MIHSLIASSGIATLISDMSSRLIRNLTRTLLALAISFVTLQSASAEQKIDIAKQFDGKLFTLTSTGNQLDYKLEKKPQFYLFYFSASW